MKFRISKKDLIILIVFLVFLLYLCAIGVMNFVTFGSKGTLYGLNPFPAFSKDYIALTLLLYFICVIVIFASVSSYVFEKKSGKGVGVVVEDKVETGYSSWAKEKSIKEDRGVAMVDYTAPTITAAGIPLIYDTKKHEVWVDNGEYHTVVIGSSGSGKSQCIVKPLVNMLAKKGESMIITDPKGELYQSAATRLKQLGYNVIVLNFRDPLRGNAWNPLTLPYQYMKMGNMDKATELLDDVALNILYDPNNKGEPFWEKSAADFFSGLALGLFQDAKEEEININSISYMSNVGDERLGPSNYLKEYFNLKGEDSPAYTFAANTINAPSDTKGGIMSTFRQKIRLFASRKNLSEMLGHSDFSILDIGKQKTAVFIVIHDEKTTYHALATIFIKQAYETLVDVAQENGGKLPIRTNFILDEFANMPPLKDVDSMVTAARSRCMRFTFIIQNFAQLNDVYGKEVAEVIRGNCGNTIYLISSELAALEEISKMCGEVKSKEKDKTASTPLITVSDLQKFKMGEALLIRTRKGPFKTKLQFDYKMNWGYEQIDAQFPIRESKNVELFDIKTFVKEKKKEQSLKNPTPMNPFGGTTPFDNPFAPNQFGATNAINPFAPQAHSPMPNQNINPLSTPTQTPASNPFGMPNTQANNNGFGSNLDLDAMLKDIDKKIAELDAQEAREKEEARKKQEMAMQNTQNTVVPNKETPNINNMPPFPDINYDINALSNNAIHALENNKPLEQTKTPDISVLPENNNFHTSIPDAEIKSPELKSENINNKFINEINSISAAPSLSNNNSMSEIQTNAYKTPTTDNNINISDALSNPLAETPSFPFKEKVEIEPATEVSKSTNNSLRDMLYNPANTAFNTDVLDETPKTNPMETISNIDKTSPVNQNTIKQFETKPITNEVIKSSDKPKINIKPEEITNTDNLISDDEFFDDFFGEE